MTVIGRETEKRKRQRERKTERKEERQTDGREVTTSSIFLRNRLKNEIMYCATRSYELLPPLCLLLPL